MLFALVLGAVENFRKKTLIRFIGHKNETLRIDNQKKLHGRAAYVCPSQLCIQKAFKSPRRINSLLRVQLTNVVIERFEKVLLEWTEKSASTTGKKEELP
jgi:predicted RNA-binding protein YlxR (DUF448 family)